MKARVYVTSVIILTSLLSACSSVKMSQVWQAKDFRKKQLHQVLVVGLTASTVNRMVFEQTFSSQLSKAGITSTESFKVLGNELPSRKSIENYVKTHHIDFVLVTYQSGQDVTNEYIKPIDTNYVTSDYPIPDLDPTLYPYPTLDSFWSPGSFVTTRTGGYEEQSVKTFLVTSIYNAKNGQMVWRGTSSVFDPDSLSTASSQIAKVILEHIK